MVGDRHAVCVAAEIAEDVLGAGAGVSAWRVGAAYHGLGEDTSSNFDSLALRADGVMGTPGSHTLALESVSFKPLKNLAYFCSVQFLSRIELCCPPFQLRPELKSEVVALPRIGGLHRPLPFTLVPNGWGSAPLRSPPRNLSPASRPCDKQRRG
jgi:hypothetical protein